MLGSTILSVFAALSFGLVSVATPLQPRTSELKTRDETIGSILGSLSSQIGGPIDQLNAAVESNDTSGIVSALNSLSGAFSGATGDAQSLSPATALGGGTKEDAAKSYSEILDPVATALDPVQALAAVDSEISDAFNDLIAAINPLSAALEELVDGLLALVRTLLIAVAALLTRLGIALIGF